MKRIIFSFVFSVLSISSASAENWKLITHTSESYVFMDLDSIRNISSKSGNVRVATERIFFKSPMLVPGAPMGLSIADVEIKAYCDRREISHLKTKHYYTNDTIDQEKLPDNPVRVIKNSVMEMAYLTICSKQ